MMLANAPGQNNKLGAGGRASAPAESEVGWETAQGRWMMKKASLRLVKRNRARESVRETGTGKQKSVGRRASRDRKATTRQSGEGE